VRAAAGATPDRSGYGAGMSDFADSFWALPLDGWDELSTWGFDTGQASFFAQLTQNGRSDDDGPQV
jgi:hypothetical protein